MNIKTVEAGEGARWLSEGWRLFLRNPGMWVALMIILLLVSVAAHFIPLIGPLAFSLILPALGAGLYYGARQLDEGQDLTLDHLFIGLTDPNKRNPLLLLGALYIGAIIVMVIVMMIFGGSAIMGAMMGGQGGAAFTGIGLIALLVGLCLAALIAMGFLYASPLVMFDNIPPVEALKASFDACLKNIASMLVFSLIAMVLTVIAIIPFGLGLLVLGPVMVGAIYASYKSIFATAVATLPPAQVTP
jgi:uncharacterized membrane protein